jgi:hypothetical protein
MNNIKSFSFTFGLDFLSNEPYFSLVNFNKKLLNNIELDVEYCIVMKLLSIDGNAH